LSDQRALSASGVSVGVDTSEVIRRHAKRMHERQQRAEQELLEQESRWKYEERESFVCVAKKVQGFKESELPLYVASTVTEVGKAGIVSTRPEQRQFLEAQMRLDLARAFVRHGMVRTWDDARARAAKATVLFADTEVG
jgi:hypothetical protein